MPESKYTIITSPEALEEIDDLSIFFDDVKPGLGDMFIDQLGDLLLSLSENPFKWQYARAKEDRIRRAIFFQPSVVVLFTVEDLEVRVLSVKDTRSNWK